MRPFFIMATLLTSFIFTNAFSTPVPPLPADNKPSNVNMGTNEPKSSPNPPSLHANLNLKQEGQRLYAHVLIEQAENTNGKVRIDWMPPAHSSCDKSSYFLPYQGKKFHTQAYRTLGYSLISGKSITCTGIWHASVLNDQGTVLSTATIKIESVDSYANNNAEKMHSLAEIA